MLTITEVAQLLNVHPNTLRRWSDNGIIKAFRIGIRGDRRFRRKDINRLLADAGYPEGFKTNLSISSANDIDLV